MSLLTAMNDPVKRKKILFYPIYALAVLILLALLGVSYTSTRDQQHSAVRINLAGRQRMLSQKLVKEVLIFRLQGQDRASIDMTISVFDATLHALLDGGHAPADLEGTHHWSIPPIPAGLTRAALDDVHRLWEPFKERVALFETTGREADLREIIASSPRLLSRIEDSVVALQRRAERDNRIARASLASLIILVILITGAFLIVIVRRLRRATETIRKLETILPVCSNCKMIRTREDPFEQESWVPLEEYLHEKDGMEITHGLCPRCSMELYPDLYRKVLEKRKAKDGGATGK